MSRIISYFPKQTAAKTEYREINEDDMAWLKTELIRYLSIMAERDLRSDSDNKWILNQFWHARTDKLHKGKYQDKYRQNTPCSLIGGLVNNLIFGNQRDLTDKQMADIEYISMALATIHDIDPVRFQLRFFS